MSNNNTATKGHTLYICYFGLRESLVQTQVLPYLRQIRDGGVKVSILTFEPNPRELWTEEQIERERNTLKEEGINWYHLTYHKSPSVPATFYDILSGVFFIKQILKKENVDVLHGRGHVPTLIGEIARKLSGKKIKLLFDIRGFVPEEYTDGGNWKKDGWLYRGLKKVEKKLLKTSDGFIVLTEKARNILFPESAESGFDKFGRPVEVIPCCVDLKRFEGLDNTTRHQRRKDLNLEDRSVIVYVGSFGGWYLTEETIDFLKMAKEMNPNTYAMILTQNDPKMIQDLLEQRGFKQSDFLIRRVLPSELPYYLIAGDIALSFIKQCYSKLASSPTKNAEYFACGLPVIATSGIGDTDKMFKEDGTGVLIENLDTESYRIALLEIEKLTKQPDFAEHCKKIAAKRFDLAKVGGERYRRIYQKLLAKN